jgi:hypothetical protein
MVLFFRHIGATSKAQKTLFSRVPTGSHHMSSYHEHNKIQQTYYGINASIKTWSGGRDFVCLFQQFLSDLFPMTSRMNFMIKPRLSLVTLPMKMMTMPIHGWGIFSATHKTVIRF